MLLNIHTHSSVEHPGERAIENLIIPPNVSEVGLAIGDTGDRWFSAGIHPWYSDAASFETQLGLLEEVASLSSVKLVGECGLDRLRGPDMNVQADLFEQQLRLADKLRKPVLIHCVKSFNELLAITRRVKPSVPLIVHGFNTKPEIASQLIKRGFYISFGAALLRELSNAAEVMKGMPLNQVFLENDDSDIPVRRIYERAARLKNLSINTLEDAIFGNYLSLGV